MSLKSKNESETKESLESEVEEDEDKSESNATIERETDEQIAQKLSNLPMMVAGINSSDPKVQLCYMTDFRKLLSIEGSPYIDNVIALGVVPRFVEFLNFSDYPELQCEATWALTNIASGSHDHTRVVINLGAVPIFVKLLNSPSDDVREQAVWVLGNIAGDSTQSRDFVLQLNALGPLLSQFKESSKLSLLRNATWALSNLCRGKPQPPFYLIRFALPTLARLLYSDDEDILVDACWALSYLSDGPNDRIQSVIEAGVCKRLVELMMHTNFRVQTAAMRTIGNIVTGDDFQTQTIINASTLPCLLAFLKSQKIQIRKEACWIISNITAGNRTQIAAVIDAGIISPLIKLLVDDEFDVKKEAAYAINYATSGSPEQIRYLVTCGCLKPLCDLLSVSDARIVTATLEGLENILKIGEYDAKFDPNTGGVNIYVSMIEQAGGLDQIEGLQLHYNQDIYQKAVSIIETYFSFEKGTGEVLTTNMDDTQQQ